eukprot:TRINITY_DN8394_c2_g1_i1.p1 TRINITY_DN8394_c2_g1~~TRINITY_DN8394_c2_g1_i1.p1  ORF type:complete len:226 (-),score=-8.62 TRINITY_DN8394_c2_g1_i1:29-706(-)
MKQTYFSLEKTKKIYFRKTTNSIVYLIPHCQTFTHSHKKDCTECSIDQSKISIYQINRFFHLYNKQYKLLGIYSANKIFPNSNYLTPKKYSENSFGKSREHTTHYFCYQVKLSQQMTNIINSTFGGYDVSSTARIFNMVNGSAEKQSETHFCNATSHTTKISCRQSIPLFRPIILPTNRAVDETHLYCYECFICQTQQKSWLATEITGTQLIIKPQQSRHLNRTT